MNVPLDATSASRAAIVGPLYCTGVSLKRHEYCLLNTSISRVVTFPVRSTERFLLPTGTMGATKGRLAMSSIAGRKVFKGLSVYCATKHG